jgi:hypothetical protein
LTGVWLLGWPLGAVVGLIAWATFARGPRAVRKVEAYREAAVALHRDDPETYEQILELLDVAGRQEVGVELLTSHRRRPPH